jgi:MFS family permease
LLGWLYAGWIADKVTLYLARKNNGVREPEQRLWILVPSGLIAAAGLILWGVGAAHRVHWMGLMFGLAMFQFGIVVGATTALAYNVDCFKEIAGETLILVIVIRNTMGYGMAYGITPWINASGVQNTFIGTAFLFIGCTCSFLIMTVWGKRFRKMCAKKYWHFVDTLIVASH